MLLEDEIIYETEDENISTVTQEDGSCLLTATTTTKTSSNNVTVIATSASTAANAESVTIPTSAAGIEGPAFVTSKYGTRQLVLKQHTFNRHVNREDVTYWRCSQFAVLRCRARIKTKGSLLTVLNGAHNHEVILKARKYGSLKLSKRQAAETILMIPDMPHKYENEAIEFDDEAQ